MATPTWITSSTSPPSPTRPARRCRGARPATSWSRSTPTTAARRSPCARSRGRATHTGTAETANVNVLNGLVKASAVRAVAATRANGSSSSFSSLGSDIKDLAVQGVAINNVTPNTRVDLPAAVYGVGSYVLLYEEIGSTSGPPAAQTSGGTYTADLRLNMI